MPVENVDRTQSAHTLLCGDQSGVLRSTGISQHKIHPTHRLRGRARSAPPSPPCRSHRNTVRKPGASSDLALSSQFMLSAQPIDLNFDEDDWKAPPLSARLYRAASVGSWGVTSIGRGFDWEENDGDDRVPQPSPKRLETVSPHSDLAFGPPIADVNDIQSRKHSNAFSDTSNIIPNMKNIPSRRQTPTGPLITPSQSRSQSPGMSGPFNPPPLPCSPKSPRPRRRSSQQRVSLIAGRVLIAPIELPSPTLALPPSLHRAASSSSLLSAAASTRPPSPSPDQSFLGGRSISEFLIEGEIGRGAYGLVKRGREIYADGTFGVKCVLPSFFTLC